jgi:hypothetical protein
MIHEYTLKTADTQRQLVDKTGQPLRFMRYLLAESTMKFRSNLFVHAQGGPEPLPDNVDLIVCTAGINWDVSLAPLDPPAAPSPAPPATNPHRDTAPPTPTTQKKAPARTPPVTSASPASPSPTPSGAVGVACPTCHQQPGILCTTKDGRPTSPHKLRVAAAAAVGANTDAEDQPRSAA